MLIIGKKYSLSAQDRFTIEKQFKQIHEIDISEQETEQIIQQIEAFFKIEDVSYIVLNLEKEISFELKSYLEELDYEGIKILTFGDFSKKFLQVQTITLNEENLRVLQQIRHNLPSEILKRAFDIAFSTMVVIFLLPLLLLLALWIKIASPEGKVLFTQQRLGKNGRFFRVFKFRTMVPNAEKILEEWLVKHPEIRQEYMEFRKLKNDPRIIPRVGHLLRKTSLDELPQFFNVLLGDMSVVGPRPYIKSEFYKHTQKHIDIITSVKPGVTGLWQVTERNDTNFDGRVDKDIEYIKNQTFFGDLKIVCQTVLVMLLRRGA